MPGSELLMYQSACFSASSTTLILI